MRCSSTDGCEKEEDAGGERHPIKQERLRIMVFKTATRHLVSQGYKKLLLVFEGSGVLWYV